MTVEGRHYRTIMGILLMVFGLLGYGAAFFHLNAPIEGCAPTWLHLVRQYGFPAGLVIGGYNLFQPGALMEIMTAWRKRS